MKQTTTDVREILHRIRSHGRVCVRVGPHLMEVTKAEVTRQVKHTPPHWRLTQEAMGTMVLEWEE